MGKVKHSSKLRLSTLELIGFYETRISHVNQRVRRIQTRSPLPARRSCTLKEVQLSILLHPENASKHREHYVSKKTHPQGSGMGVDKYNDTLWVEMGRVYLVGGVSEKFKELKHGIWASGYREHRVLWADGINKTWYHHSTRWGCNLRKMHWTDECAPSRRALTE